MKQIMVDLKTNMKEEKIRVKILNSCKQQLPNLTSTEWFEFVKREKNRIFTPTFEQGFKFDYNQVK